MAIAGGVGGYGAGGAVVDYHSQVNGEGSGRVTRASFGCHVVAWPAAKGTCTGEILSKDYHLADSI